MIVALFYLPDIVAPIITPKSPSVYIHFFQVGMRVKEIHQDKAGFFAAQGSNSVKNLS